jgi:hypothetical protein
VSKGVIWGSPGLPGGHFGSFGDQGILERVIWGDPGVIRGSSGVIWGSSRDHLGSSDDHLGSSGGSLGSSGGPKGTQGDPRRTQGDTRGDPRGPKGTQGGPKGHPRATQGDPRAPKGDPRGVKGDPRGQDVIMVQNIWFLSVKVARVTVAPRRNINFERPRAGSSIGVRQNEGGHSASSLGNEHQPFIKTARTPTAQAVWGTFGITIVKDILL